MFVPFRAIAAFVVLSFWASIACAADPEDWLTRVQEDAGKNVLYDVPASGPATSAPASAPATTAPSTAPAEVAWPPGLLMEGLDTLFKPDPLNAIGLHFWGYSEASFTGNLTNGQHTLFGRGQDSERPDNLQLNQLRLTMERIYDPTKPFDIGGRFDLLYGSDARFTKNTFPGGHDYAILENVGEGKGANWLDFTQAYGQLWFKTAQDSGLEVLGGKFYSPVGYEATDAAFSPMYSHSYLANFAVPTAHTGVKLNYVWNPQISTYFAVVTGWDTFDDNNDAPSYIVGGAWNSCTKCGQKSKDALTVNFITGPEKTDNSHDDRSLIDATYIHLWTEQLSSTINGDWGTEQGSGAGGGEANWYGVAHYLTYAFNDYVSATWRTEWFCDDSGIRTGHEGNYLENTLGLTITPLPNNKVLKNLSVRPELRWDHSNQPVFGDDHDMMTAAVDVIFRF